MKILVVIPGLDYGGAAKQLSLLAAGLPRDRFDLRVCVLGDEGPAAEAVRGAGVAVEALGWRHWIDLVALRRLRRQVSDFQPDVIHSWGRLALRVTGLLTRTRARLLVSAPFAGCQRRRPPGSLDRWLLRRAAAILASGPTEAARLRRIAVGETKIAQVPPAVALPEPGPSLNLKGVPPQARFLACIGPLRANKGFRDAVWTLDILRYVEADLHLLIAGDGPERRRLEEFVHTTGTDAIVHMLGRQADVFPVLDRAALAWVPSLDVGGINVALEAMAAGRPVVATRVPEMAEIVLDGQTGYRILPGDKVALARMTRRLLEDQDLCRQMGEAGRQRAAAHFAVADMVRRVAAVYEKVA